MLLVLQLIELLFTLLNLAILARVLLSFINPNPYHPLVQLIYRITEPLLAPIRRVVPPIAMFDLSPLIALIVLNVIERVVLAGLGGRF